MARTVIELENVSKYYRLGTVGGKTLNDDIKVWLAKLRGKGNPLLQIGEKDYGNQEGEYIWALRDINLKVEQGEILGIIGANGAGKSTLLKILSRVTGPTSGKIKIKGRIGSLLEVGTGFHPELTGRENVFLNGAILGMRRWEIEKKFDEIVDFSGVEKYIDTPVKRYSSGMRVRLGFAVAAHLDPEILIVDEVLAVGDAAFQKKCIGKMSDVAGEGRTVLFVSHNMGSVLNLCPKVILLENGKLIKYGNSNSIVEEYLSNSFNGVSSNDLSKAPRLKESFSKKAEIKSINISPNIINTGSEQKFELIINLKSLIKDLRIRIVIKNRLDFPVFTLNSYLQGTILSNLKIGDNVVCCKVKKLPLLEGEYKVDVKLFIFGEMLDLVTNASSFAVNTYASDIGLMKINTIEEGSVYVEANWVA